MKKEAEQVFMFACFYYTCQQNNRADDKVNMKPSGLHCDAN